MSDTPARGPAGSAQPMPSDPEALGAPAVRVEGGSTPWSTSSSDAWTVRRDKRRRTGRIGRRSVPGVGPPPDGLTSGRLVPGAGIPLPCPCGSRLVGGSDGWSAFRTRGSSPRRQRAGRRPLGSPNVGPRVIWGFRSAIDPFQPNPSASVSSVGHGPKTIGSAGSTCQQRTRENLSTTRRADVSGPTRTARTLPPLSNRCARRSGSPGARDAIVHRFSPRLETDIADR